MRKQQFYIFSLLWSFIVLASAQSINKAQWPIDWSKQEVILDISLNTHIKKGSELVATQIPDQRSEKLYALNEFTLLPNIKSTLYADKNKLVLVNYSASGKYIDHRIVAAALKNYPDTPIYSTINTQEKTITLYAYNDFGSNYDETSIKIHSDGYFQDIISTVDMEVNAVSQVALIGCNNYGLDGLYPPQEKWLLVSPYDQVAKTVTTLRYGYDFLGSHITLIDEPYEYPQNDIPYLLAFKGNYTPVDVQFYKPQNMTLQQLNQLTQQLQSTQWSMLVDNNEKDSETISKLRANIHQINQQFQLIYLQENDESGSLMIKNKGSITSVVYVKGYDLFKIDNKLYLVTYHSSEAARYVVYEIINNELNQLEDFTIACC